MHELGMGSASVAFVDAPALPSPAGGSPCYQRLSRLAWTAGFSVSCYGVNVSVRSNAAWCLERLCDLLPPGCSACRGSVVDSMVSVWVPKPRSGRGDRTRRFALLYVNDALVARDLDLAVVLRSFERQMQLGVATSAPDRVFVHAGVVGWGGRAMVMPGPSGCGKSELVCALLRRGARLYSDEYAVITADGLVEPFARPPVLRRGPTGRTRIAAATIAARGAREVPIPVGLVLFTRYEGGARWNPRRLSPAEVTVGLIENAVAARIAPARVLASASLIARAAPGLRTRRGDAAGASRRALRALDGADTSIHASTKEDTT